METSRLRLRSFTINDMEDLYAFASDERVSRMAGWRRHTCLSDSADVILNVLNKPLEWAIEVKEEHKVIGSIGTSEDIVDPNRNRCMVGFLLSYEYWGLGYAREAIEAVLQELKRLGYQTITAYHYLDNKRSERVLKRVGFQYKGIVKDAIRDVDDKVVDLCWYEINKEV